MEPISPEKFALFHERFRGDSPNIAGFCFECQGKCEKSQIGTLLPGEKEYMALRMGLPLDEFTEMYLDTLIVDGQHLDVLKLGPLCRFLTSDHACACRAFKVVMCAVYPVMFGVERGRARFFLDQACPLTRDPETARYFREVGISALEALKPPEEWFGLVAAYDYFDFDYASLRRIRSAPGRQVFRLEELLRCSVRTCENRASSAVIALGGRE